MAPKRMSGGPALLAVVVAVAAVLCRAEAQYCDTDLGQRYMLSGDHSGCLPGEYVLAEVLQEVIVAQHNEYRSNASPTASDMVPLTWDADLAMLAQKWADTCTYGHDTRDNRNLPGYLRVGQNAAQDYATWEEAMDGWHSEVKDFVHGGSNSLKMVGHYTAIMWSKTTLIGCGMNDCGGSPNYVCNYGPAGNLDINNPYLIGEPCTPCGGVCVDNLCDCGDETPTCLNRGMIAQGSCTCDCGQMVPPLPYSPEDCSLDCSTGRDYSSCDDLDCSSFSGYCPYKCGLC